MATKTVEELLPGDAIYLNVRCAVRVQEVTERQAGPYRGNMHLTYKVIDVADEFDGISIGSKVPVDMVGP